MMRKTCLCLMSTFLVVALFACSKSPQERLNGTWKKKEVAITFSGENDIIFKVGEREDKGTYKVLSDTDKLIAIKADFGEKGDIEMLFEFVDDDTVKWSIPASKKPEIKEVELKRE